MSQSSDDIIGGPAPQGESSDDDIIMLGSVAAAPAGRRAGGPSRRTGRPRVPSSHGRFSSLLCVDTRLGPAPAELQDCVDGSANGYCAAICECEWTFVSVKDAAPSVPRQELFGRQRCPNPAQTYGHILYEVCSIYRLAPFLPAHRWCEQAARDGCIAEFIENLLEQTLHSGLPARSLPSSIIDTARFVLPNVSFATLVAMFDATLPALLFSVPLSLRTQVHNLFVGYPPRASVRRWRALHNVARAKAANQRPALEPRAYKDIVLELPNTRRARRDVAAAPTGNRHNAVELDPVRVIQALTFAQFLKSQKAFSQALDAAWDLNHDSDDDEARDRSNDVSRTFLFRWFSRLDSVSCLLHRRQWHADRLLDLIDAVTILTDASPNSGLEFQGMVAVARRTDESWYTVTFPGSSLAYGIADAISKGIALLWGIWLLTGPELADIQYF